MFVASSFRDAVLAIPPSTWACSKSFKSLSAMASQSAGSVSTGRQNIVSPLFLYLTPFTCFVCFWYAALKLGISFSVSLTIIPTSSCSSGHEKPAKWFFCAKRKACTKRRFIPSSAGGKGGGGGSSLNSSGMSSASLIIVLVVSRSFSDGLFRSAASIPISVCLTSVRREVVFAFSSVSSVSSFAAEAMRPLQDFEWQPL